MCYTLWYKVPSLRVKFVKLIVPAVDKQLVQSYLYLLFRIQNNISKWFYTYKSSSLSLLEVEQDLVLGGLQLQYS